MVTPFGVGRETSWRGLLSGESATRRVDDAVGAPAAHFVASDVGEPVVDLALISAGEAVADAGLELQEMDCERIGCVLGTSKPLLRTFADVRRMDFRSVRPGELQRARSHLTDGLETRPTGYWPNEPALAVSRELGIAGPALCPVAACATGLVSLQRGVELIRDGHADTVLAGSSDASLLPIVLGSFKRLGVLARNVEDPAAACRPFDLRRSGFVVGEGAAVLVLERLDNAVARGANIYAEWLAGGMASDGGTLTGLDEEGESLARLIADVLRRADVSAQEIDAVNLHGTATRQNDVYETRALKGVLGRHAFDVSCCSLKGGIGHLLGAAGSVETAAALLAMRDGIVPPTVNLETPDPECDLDYTPRAPRRRGVRTALKLSLGFGGHLAAAVLRAV